MAILKRLLDLITQEPALVAGFVTAAIALLVAFGVVISPDQQSRIQGLVAAVVAILAAFWVRSQVTPVVKLPTPPPPAA